MMKMTRVVFPPVPALMAAVCIGCTEPAQPVLQVEASAAAQAVDTIPIPLIDMGDSLTYFGFEGGLYPGGSNTIPPTHAALAPPVEPIDGKYVLTSAGMSNTALKFCTNRGLDPCSVQSFMGQAAVDPDVNRTELVIVNGAQGGMVADTWADPSARAWQILDQRLGGAGVRPDQVEVFWMLHVNAFPQQARPSLPNATADAYRLLGQFGAIVRNAKARYRNLRRVYFSSRIWSSIKAPGGLNPEPYAYENGYAVKWLIAAQIRQLTTGQVDPIAGDLSLDVAPWLAWGPYLWADDGKKRSDGLVWLPSDLRDGTHPDTSGVRKVGAMLLDFFKHSPTTAA